MLLMDCQSIRLIIGTIHEARTRLLIWVVPRGTEAGTGTIWPDPLSEARLFQG